MFWYVYEHLCLGVFWYVYEHRSISVNSETNLIWIRRAKLLNSVERFKFCSWVIEDIYALLEKNFYSDVIW